MAYHAFKSSSILAQKFGAFEHFKESKFADGSYFDKYTKVSEKEYQPKTQKLKKCLKISSYYSDKTRLNWISWKH